MALQHPKVMAFALLSSLFLMGVKLFTAVVRLKGDPTTFLVFCIEPALRTDFTLMPLSPFDDARFYVLLLDENGFVGQDVYYFITDYLWWSVPVLTVVVFLIFLLRNKNMI